MLALRLIVVGSIRDSGTGRIRLFGPSLLQKLPKYSFPVRNVHRLQLFELVQEGASFLGVVTATFQFRDDFTLTDNVLPTRLDVHLCLRQMALEHRPIHCRRPIPSCADRWRGFAARLTAPTLGPCRGRFSGLLRAEPRSRG